MKRPGRIIKADKVSEVIDEPIILLPREKIVKILKENGHLSMFKLSMIDGLAPRTVRGYLTELVGMNIIKRDACPQCGSNTTYKLA